MQGRIEVITGSMFSGKTEELIRRVRRAMLARLKVQAFKPAVDDRYNPTRIVSHGSLYVEAHPVAVPAFLAKSVKPDTQVVAIDEAQFFDVNIVDVANKLADEGKRVIVAGLDQDFQGKPFGPMPSLMAIAEMVTKVRAVCVRCGADASRTQRTVKDDTQVRVGGEEDYEARCRTCHDPLG